MKNILEKSRIYLYQAGFTVIELVVVVAIMAVLSTIVAANIMSYLSKGKDAAIKGNMHSIASSATVFFDKEKEWNNVFNPVNNPSILVVMDAINKTTAPNSVWRRLSSDNSSWCVCSFLTQIVGASGTSNTYCIDSSGYRKETTNHCSLRCTNTTGSCLD